METAISTEVAQNLTVFNNPEFGKVRTMVVDDEPWFVGKDVAIALKYKQHAKAVREHVEDGDKGVSKLDTPGGKQSMVIINESGLYSLIFNSKTDKAKEFKHWVTSEILPSLRKTGAYAINPMPNPQEVLSSYEAQIEALTEQLNSIEEQLTQKVNSIGGLVVDCRNMLYGMSNLRVVNAEPIVEEVNRDTVEDSNMDRFDWKQAQYKKIKVLTDRGWCTHRGEALGFIYSRMESQYGIHLDLLQDEYRHENGFRPNRIDLAYTNLVYRDIFEAILSDMLSGVLQFKKNEPKPEALMVAPVQEMTMYEETVHQIESIEEAVNLLAAKFEDKTPHNCNVFNLVYRYMEKSDALRFSWNKSTMWFVKRNGRKPHNRRELLEESPVCTKKFIQAATEMLAS